MSDASLVIAAIEPQHLGRLESVCEHDQEWVTCLACGRQWSIHGNDADLVSYGDGYCDEKGVEDY